MRLLLNQMHAGMGVRAKYQAGDCHSGWQWFCRVAASFNEALQLTPASPAQLSFGVRCQFGQSVVSYIQKQMQGQI
jgi:hypothetical protein